MDFKNPDVAAKYEATGEDDVKIHSAKFKGMLSDVDLRGAEHLVKVKDANIRVKVKKNELAVTSKTDNGNSLK